MLLPSWNMRVNSFSFRISASCRVAAKALAVSEASESVSGWSSSDAVVIGWPEVETRARKEQSSRLFSSQSRLSQRSS